MLDIDTSFRAGDRIIKMICLVLSEHTLYAIFFFKIMIGLGEYSPNPIITDSLLR